MLIALDFASGQHGHFLEFITNKFIYNISSDKQNIFQSSGAAHTINIDHQYQKEKMVHCAHYTSFGIDYPTDTSQIIFVDHTPELDFVLLTNVYYRCHPDLMLVDETNLDKITQLHDSMLAANSDLERRNNWFAKLNERYFKDQLNSPVTDIPVYFFNYKSFFSLIEFCSELKNLAKFLGETFRFDPVLAEYWTDFINKNQGWKLYEQGNSLLDFALRGVNAPIPNDWKLHAYLNYKLSKDLNIHDGLLFAEELYPDTTLELAKLINIYIKEHQ
jgi:hypothetical protein